MSEERGTQGEAAVAHEEERELLEELEAYWRDRGNPIRKVTRHKGEQVNLAKLYKEVQARGGYDQVASKRQWRDVFRAAIDAEQEMTMGNVAKACYEKFLLDFEREGGYKPAATQSSAGKLLSALAPSTGPVAALSLPGSPGPLHAAVRSLCARTELMVGLPEALNQMGALSFEGLPPSLSRRCLVSLLRCASALVNPRPSSSLPEIPPSDVLVADDEEPARKRRRIASALGQARCDERPEPEAAMNAARNFLLGTGARQGDLALLDSHAGTLLMDDRTREYFLGMLKACLEQPCENLKPRMAFIQALATLAETFLEEKEGEPEERRRAFSIAARAVELAHPMDVVREDGFGRPRLLLRAAHAVVRFELVDLPSACEAANLTAAMCQRGEGMGENLALESHLCKHLARLAFVQTHDAKTPTWTRLGERAAKAAFFAASAHFHRYGSLPEWLPPFEVSLSQAACTRGASSLFAHRALSLIQGKNKERGY